MKNKSETSVWFEMVDNITSEPPVGNKPAWWDNASYAKAQGDNFDDDWQYDLTQTKPVPK